MAKRGPKPAPTRLKVARGTAEKNPQRINKHEPEPKPGAPPMPPHLDGKAKQFWKWIVYQLDDMGILSQADAYALEIMAVTYGQWWECYSQVKKAGGVMEDAYGVPRRHPLAVDMNKHRDTLVKLFPEFGLTPSSRSRISIPTDNDLDEAEAFFRTG